MNIDTSRRYNFLTNKELRLKHNSQAEITIKCKCGHSIVLTPKLDRVFCDWCGHYCYRNKKVEFKYKLMEEMNARRTK